MKCEAVKVERRPVALPMMGGDGSLMGDVGLRCHAPNGLTIRAATRTMTAKSNRRVKLSGKPLRPPVLDAEDRAYGEKLAALSDEDMKRLAAALLDLKPAEGPRSFEEMREITGL